MRAAIAGKSRLRSPGEVLTLVPGTAGYPPRLSALWAELPQLHLLDKPLWLRGQVEALQARPAVTVVGSRAASAAGEALAHALGAAVAELGGLVISGGAMGIDAAAHRGALAAGGRTCAVLGCGVDVAYPQRHARLFSEIRERGCLLSSFAPGAEPLRWHFPVRNELMAGLADLVVVIEARADSGSLITVRHAQRHGRRVAAFAGSAGAELALKAGAYLLQSVADVVALIARLPGLATAGVDELPSHGHATSSAAAFLPVPRAPTPSFINEATGEAAPALAVMAALAGVSALDLGELCARTGLMPGDCAAALVDLELRGRCTRLAGGRYTMHPPLS